MSDLYKVTDQMLKYLTDAEDAPSKADLIGKIQKARSNARGEWVFEDKLGLGDEVEMPPQDEEG